MDIVVNWQSCDLFYQIEDEISHLYSFDVSGSHVRKATAGFTCFYQGIIACQQLL